MEHFDIIVIGSGPGGYRAAILSALAGKRVAIVEKAQWGGCCLNRGCVPKKDWYHTARLVEAASQGADRGLEGTLQANLAQAWLHQQQVVNTVRENYVNYLQRLGVARFSGTGSLVDAHTVAIAQVDGSSQTLTAGFIVLATGSSPIVPPALPETAGRILTTDTLFDQPPPPGRRIAIIGGGVVGVEFAYIFKQFGFTVSWYSPGRALARAGFSPQAMNILLQSLRAQGITPIKARPQLVGISETGVRLGGDGSDVEVDWVLLGTGRKPHTTALGLEKTAATTNAAGFINTDAHLQTAEPNIYAIGDCTSPELTANQALADATVAIHNILRGNSRQRDPLWVPKVVYSAVALARLGMNDDQAEDAGFEPAIGFAAYASSPQALGQDDSQGFVRLLADMDSGQLLGGEIVGAEAGELIHLLNARSDAPLDARTLAQSFYNHPARAEEVLNAVETMVSKWGIGDS